MVKKPIGRGKSVETQSLTWAPFSGRTERPTLALPQGEPQGRLLGLLPLDDAKVSLWVPLFSNALGRRKVIDPESGRFRVPLGWVLSDNFRVDHFPCRSHSGSITFLHLRVVYYQSQRYCPTKGASRAAI